MSGFMRAARAGSFRSVTVTGGGMAGVVVMLPAAGDTIVGVIGETSATLARTDPRI